MDERKINPPHAGVRQVLRIAGPIILALGVLLTVHGFTGAFGGGERSGGFGPRRDAFPPDFDSAARRMHDDFESTGRRMRSSAGCIFAGFALIFVGGVMTGFGFMGAVARYKAAEIAPVGKDAFNYLAAGTHEGVKTVAGAVGEGLAQGLRGPGQKTVLRCHKCNAENDAAARFCSQCGAGLVKSRPCPHCGELNDGDAKFCDNCGRALQ